MANRPYVAFQEVKDKVSLIEVLQRLDLLDTLKREGDHWVGPCPLHQHGPIANERGFRVDCKDGVWLFHCFSTDPSDQCGKGGDVVSFVRFFLKLDDRKAGLWFAREFGSRLNLSRPNENKQSRKLDYASDNPSNQSPNSKTSPVNRTNPAPDTSHSELAVPTTTRPLKPLRFRLNLTTPSPYLLKRGISEETQKKFEIGDCGKGVLAGRVAFPVKHWIDGAWRTVGYFGRYAGEDYDEVGESKYAWGADGLERHVLFGLPQALQYRASPATILVESPMDCLHLTQHGFPSVVALVEPHLTEEQAELLAASKTPVVLLFHRTEAAHAAAHRAATVLIGKTFVRGVFLPDGKQPEHFTVHALRRLLSFFKDA